MRKSILFTAFAAVINSSFVHAQLKVDIDLPSSPIVYNNPEVKGYRLDSIVSTLGYSDRYDQRIIFDYDIVDGVSVLKDTRCINKYPQGGDGMSFDITCLTTTPTKTFTDLNGMYLELSDSETTKGDITEHTISAGDYLVSKETYKTEADGQKWLQKLVKNTYDDHLNAIFSITEEYDKNGNIVNGSKRTVSADYEGENYPNDIKTTTITYTYSTAKKAYVAVKKEVVEEYYGFVRSRYVYEADADGRLGECNYSIVKTIKYADMSQNERDDAYAKALDKLRKQLDEAKITQKEYEEKLVDILSLKGGASSNPDPHLSMTESEDVITVVENGVKTVTRELTRYFVVENKQSSGDDDQDTDDQLYSVSYKYDANGNLEDKYYKKEFVKPVFYNRQNGNTRYGVVELVRGQSIDATTLPFSNFDNRGYCTMHGIWKPFVFANTVELDKVRMLKDYAYVTYKYHDGKNIGWVTRGSAMEGYYGAWLYDSCLRDQYYTDVVGSDAISPIVYMESERDYFAGPLYSIFYYSSSNSHVYADDVDRKGDRKMVQHGKRWYFSLFADPTFSQIYPDIDIYSSGTYFFDEDCDTIIDGKTYLRLTYDWMCSSLPNNDGDVVAILREEGGKVYKYDEKTKKEYLVYDFTVTTGDTFTLTSPTGDEYNCTVLSDEVVEYNGEPLKTLTIESYVANTERDEDKIASKSTNTWIQGIGSYDLAQFPYDGKIGRHVLYPVAYVTTKSGDFWPLDFDFGTLKGEQFFFGRNVDVDYDYPDESRDSLSIEYDEWKKGYHVTGVLLGNCGPNHYMYQNYVYDNQTDTSDVTIRIELVEPAAECESMFEVDFWVYGENLSSISVGDKKYNANPALSVKAVSSDTKGNKNMKFDMSGRKIVTPSRRSLYIEDGKVKGKH